MATPYQKKVCRVIDEEGKDGECSFATVNRGMMLGTDYVKGILVSMDRIGYIDFIKGSRVRLTTKGFKVIGKTPPESEEVTPEVETPESRFKRWLDNKKNEEDRLALSRVFRRPKDGDKNIER